MKLCGTEIQLFVEIGGPGGNLVLKLAPAGRMDLTAFFEAARLAFEVALAEQPEPVAEEEKLAALKRLLSEDEGALQAAHNDASRWRGEVIRLIGAGQDTVAAETARRTALAGIDDIKFRTEVRTAAIKQAENGLLLTHERRLHSSRASVLAAAAERQRAIKTKLLEAIAPALEEFLREQIILESLPPTRR